MNYWAVGQNPFWSTNAMQITVVAVMCHTIGAFFPESVGTVPAPVYRGDQWRISRIKCVPGYYVPKERV
jgi:hypothetical protein